MASIQRQASSGSDVSQGATAVIDERKRKRMLSNRESARRSRQRKQKQMEDLTGEISRLQISNGQILQSVNLKEQAYVQIESANNVLRAQIMELTDRLRSLNAVLHVIEEVSGLAVDIPEVPNPLMKPWQHSTFVQPITASADMFLN
ncbi:hypothetical protein TIFTF001_021463 [Ficus carica]|uniref:BZIP domain-containing protein n=1 Tax=Ficus carica TaxID=3494 RepID=A0AA88ACS2_FICCA|nr:hypothetical protein TIFTF001_021463 [Ficus carica]